MFLVFWCFGRIVKKSFLRKLEDLMTNNQTDDVTAPASLTSLFSVGGSACTNLYLWPFWCIIICQWDVPSPPQACGAGCDQSAAACGCGWRSLMFCVHVLWSGPRPGWLDNASPRFRNGQTHSPVCPTICWEGLSSKPLQPTGASKSGGFMLKCGWIPPLSDSGRLWFTHTQPAKG